MKKTKDLHLRVDLFDEKIIKIKAKESGLSTSEYIGVSRRNGENSTLTI